MVNIKKKKFSTSELIFLISKFVGTNLFFFGKVNFGFNPAFLQIDNVSSVIFSLQNLVP